MGIKALSHIIGDFAPTAIKNNDIKSYFGRKIAIDASMSLYQFLIAVRQQDGSQLMSESGETTSHLMGIFYRTLRMIDNGIKPCYVFDGSPPKLKSGELAKRTASKAEASRKHEEAKESGTVEDIDRFSRRTVRVTKTHNEECQKLLGLMGIPFVIAPCEAEAQCAALAKAGKVFAAASEDMDTLSYGAPILLRHLTFSEQRKEPITEYHLSTILEKLDMSQEKFIDLCVLLGCDYLEPLKKVGPSTAYKLINQYGSLENFVKATDHKFQIPENWPWSDARDLFIKPLVKDPAEIDLKWTEPDLDGLIDFLVKEKGFNEDRVRNGAARLKNNLKQAQQSRLDQFFTPVPKQQGTKRQSATETKPKTKNSKLVKTK